MVAFKIVFITVFDTIITVSDAIQIWTILPGSRPLLTGLIAYWQMDEASGDALDLVAGNHLSPVGAVSSAAGRVGTARDFDSNLHQYLSRVAGTALSTGDIDFTFSCWVRARGFTHVPSSAGIISKWIGTQSARELLLGYVISPSASFRLLVNTSTDSPTNVYSTNAGVPLINTWYHIVCWHDSVNSLIGISVNGSTANTVAHTGDIRAVVTTPFAVGTLANDASGFEDHWNGQIDEMGFWKRMLTPTERAALYNSGRGLTYPFNYMDIASADTVSVTEVKNWLFSQAVQTFYAEDLTQSSISFAAPATTKTELAITPDAGKDYWVLFSARVTTTNQADTTAVTLNHPNKDTTLRKYVRFPNDTDLNDEYRTVFGIDRILADSSPSSQQLELQYKGNVGGNPVISHSTVFMLKADPQDQYAESEADTANATTTLADKTTLTFTPATAGDYLILACAKFPFIVNSTQKWRTVLEQDGSVLYGDSGSSAYNPNAGSQSIEEQWAVMVKVTLTAVSHTFKIRYSTITSGSVTIGNAVILALRLSRFKMVQYAEARARTTTTSTSYVDKVALSFIPNEANYLVLCSGQLDCASDTSPIGFTLDKDGVSQVDQFHQATAGQSATAATDGNFPSVWFYKPTLIERPTQFKIGTKSPGGFTAGISNAAITVLELNESEPVTLLTGLIAYWPLNETSGDARDTFGLNDLTDRNTVGSAVGRVGGGRDFERNNSQFFSRAHTTSLTVNETVSFTFQVWVKYESFPAGISTALVSKASDSHTEYYVGYKSTNDTFLFEIWSTDQGAINGVEDTFGPKLVGVWYCIHA